MCEGPIKGSEAEAIEAWNARATDAELSRVTEERDKETWRVGQAEQELAKVRAERDAALRRVEELEGLATGNECHAAGGTWFEVFVSDDRLGGTETEGDECPTLGKVFPARLDAAEKGGKQ